MYALLRSVSQKLKKNIYIIDETNIIKIESGSKSLIYFTKKKW